MSGRTLRRVHAQKTAHTDNTNVSSKVTIRRHVLGLLAAEGIATPPILDVFCGQGILWRQAYARTSAYLGLDQKRVDDGRQTIVCDNRRYLRHAQVDLDQYALFDIDAHGFPQECLALICHRLTW